ncbi:MAG: phosphatase [Bacillota bacterium]
MNFFKVDLHTHTIASGHAYSTLHENFMQAKEKGITMLAVTDHGPQMPGGPHLYYFGNLRVLPMEYLGVELLRGAEANIIGFQGQLDIPDGILKRLDIVLAGFHTGCFPGGDVEENTQALINAMKHPYVDVIVHPGNPEFTINPVKLVEASKELGVALEINNSSLTTSRKGSLENCRVIAKIAAQKGSIISLGSDAHWAPLIGDFSKALTIVKESGLKEGQILNSNPDLVREYLRKKKRPSPIQISYPSV